MKFQEISKYILNISSVKVFPDNAWTRLRIWTKDTAFSWQCTLALWDIVWTSLENFEKIRCCPPDWLHLGQNSLTGKYKLFRLLRFRKRTHWRETYIKWNPHKYQRSSEDLICTQPSDTTCHSSQFIRKLGDYFRIFPNREPFSPNLFGCFGILWVILGWF